MASGRQLQIGITWGLRLCVQPRHQWCTETLANTGDVVLSIRVVVLVSTGS